MMGAMGYAEKLQKLCALRSLDQATLANKLGLSKSSISRILSGIQEPKLLLAYDLAKALGVTCEAFAGCEDIASDASSETARPKKPQAARPKMPGPPAPKRRRKAKGE